MKRLAALALPLVALAMISCGTNRAAVAEAALAAEDFSGAMGRNWTLVEMRTAARSVTLDRSPFDEVGIGDTFTLRFDIGGIFGTAVVNSFRGPYVLGAYREITIGDMAVTLAFPLVELDELSEYEFVTHYLPNVFEWAVVGASLELRTTSVDGTETVLVFIEK